MELKHNSVFASVVSYQYNKFQCEKDNVENRLLQNVFVSTLGFSLIKYSFLAQHSLKQWSYYSTYKSWPMNRITEKPY